MKKFYNQLEKGKNFFEAHYRHLMTLSFLVGFTIDNLTLTRIDLLLDNLILFTYLIIACAGIVATNFFEAHKLKGSLFARIGPFFPLAIQFALGGLFSGLFVFYSRSASLAGSWLFLVVLVGLLLGNEFFEKYYRKLAFQVSVLFFAFFSFAIFFIPVILKTFGVWTFVLSGVISILFIAFFVRALGHFIPSRVRETTKSLIIGVGGIFFAINIFYFTNITPPLPLSLKDAGVYHSVKRTPGGEYAVQYEPRKWYQFYKSYNDSFHLTEGGAVYFYSAVFAPTALGTHILHRWWYYDEIAEEWRETDKVRFPIVGGADGGYRGFSTKSVVVPGMWRVDVITERGQVLGRETFMIIKTEDSPALEWGIL